MADWTKDELDRITAADELEIEPLRRDGTSAQARSTTIRLVPR